MLIPGKLYRTKKEMWFYDHNSGGPYNMGTYVMFLGAEIESEYFCDVIHIYFLVDHEKLHFDSYNFESYPEEVELCFEELP